jgi:chromosome segregation ATPase
VKRIAFDSEGEKDYSVSKVNTTPSTSVTPPEISENIDLLNQKIEGLQRELVQAQEVWQTTLADEKKRFDELLERKNLAMQEQDSQWERQSQAYEARLAEVTTEFESRLKQTEQNAARALTELDDAWQRDKLEWGPGTQAEWPAQRRELEARIQTLDEKLAELEKVHAEQTAFGPTPETVKALQNQLLEFQQTVATLQDRASRSDDLVSACVQALDYQISVLYDLVHHYAAPSANEDGGLVQS